MGPETVRSRRKKRAFRLEWSSRRRESPAGGVGGRDREAGNSSVSARTIRHLWARESIGDFTYGQDPILKRKGRAFPRTDRNRKPEHNSRQRPNAQDEAITYTGPDQRRLANRFHGCATCRSQCKIADRQTPRFAIAFPGGRGIGGVFKAGLPERGSSMVMLAIGFGAGVAVSIAALWVLFRMAAREVDEAAKRG
jgi:hypothetical protein